MEQANYNKMKQIDRIEYKVRTNSQDINYVGRLIILFMVLLTSIILVMININSLGDDGIGLVIIFIMFLIIFIFAIFKGAHDRRKNDKLIEKDYVKEVLNDK